MSREVYNMIKLCGLAGVLYSPNAEYVWRLYSHYDWYKKVGQVNRILMACTYSTFHLLHAIDAYYKLSQINKPAVLSVHIPSADHHERQRNVKSG